MTHRISRLTLLACLAAACSTPQATSPAKDVAAPADVTSAAEITSVTDVPDTSADLQPSPDLKPTGKDLLFPDWSGCPAKPDAAADVMPDIYLPPCATETDCTKVSDKYCQQPHCVEGHCKVPGPDCCDPTSPYNQCNDNQKCTSDECINYQCVFIAQQGCCAENINCDDNNICTIDICDPVARKCIYVPNPECCNDSCDCDDGDPCTYDECDIFQHMCSHAFKCGADAGP